MNKNKLETLDNICALKRSFKRALENIAKYGDTDIFPHPLEKTIFHDSEDQVLELLMDMHKNFEDWIYRNPPFNENQLVPVGYSGFRWATQLDPLWSAYFLGLVISIGDKIENIRIPTESQRVFSYRFVSNLESKLFNPNIGWHTFHQRSLELANSFKTIAICDISDFYQRIRHHRLENALKGLKNVEDIPYRINKFLGYFSGAYSHGVPIGGQASRILSELLLNQTDQLLCSEGISFCRFVDDYHLFAQSEDEAYDNLLFLSKKLLINEGLSLQKAKTRIMSSAEFKSTSPLSEVIEVNDQGDTRAFLSLSLNFDPYSLTAEEDYEALKSEIEKFDLIGLLRKEVAKSRIDITVTKQVIKGLKYISELVRDQAVRSVCDSLGNLYPIFPTAILVIKSIWLDISDDTKQYVGKCIRGLFKDKSHLLKTEINQMYAIRLLACENSQENIELFQKLFNTTESCLIKRDIILAMFNWRYVAWLSDLRSQYRAFPSPLRSAFIIGSYSLGDEGKHWRTHNKKGFSKLESIIQKWASFKANQKFKELWRVPL